MRISRIRLSDHLHPAACAASLPNGSPCPPCDTADIGHEESGTPIVSWQIPRRTGAYAEAITATRSERPSPPYGKSGCCSQPESRYTTHSGRDSASGSRCRLVHHSEKIGPPRVSVDGYCGVTARLFARPHQQHPPRSFTELEAQKREPVCQRCQPTLLLINDQFGSKAVVQALRIRTAGALRLRSSELQKDVSAINAAVETSWRQASWKGRSIA